MHGWPQRLGISTGVASLAGAFILVVPRDETPEPPLIVTIRDVPNEAAAGVPPAHEPATTIRDDRQEATHTPATTVHDTTRTPLTHQPRKEPGSNAAASDGANQSRESWFRRLRDRPPLDHLRQPTCAKSLDAAAMTDLFRSAAPIAGADYQRAFPLPDGRVLWLFQDAFVSTSTGRVLLHNAGVLQSGRCVQPLLAGTEENPLPYLFADATAPFDRWFWPLGGDIGADSRLHVFVAEFHERGDHYLQNSEPVATWLVSIDLDDFSVHDARPAPDASADLYGWSVVSHRDHTYLYAHCYRQFGWDLFPFTVSGGLTHDWSCTAKVTVARIPRGEFDSSPTYWNGSQWTASASSAMPVFDTHERSVNATQVAVLDDHLLAVTKVGDWWGKTILLEVAATPVGPWRTYRKITVEPDCAQCNTYFASFVPFGQRSGSITIGLSRNTWPGDDIERYSPRFFRVPTPPAIAEGRATAAASSAS